MTTLYREIDALGGAVEDAWGEGYSQALTDALAILTARGFTEHADAGLQHVAYFDEGEFAWMSGIAPHDCELFAARRAVAKAGGQA